MVIGEVTMWKMLDIWIPAVRATEIIGTELRGGSTYLAHHQKHDLRRAWSGSIQEGKRITCIWGLKITVGGQLFEELLAMWIKGLAIRAPDILVHMHYT